MRWVPERETTRMRNATVVSVAGNRAVLDFGGVMDGVPVTVPDVPVYGPPPVAGARVLVLEQGGGMTVLGNAVTVTTEIRALREEVGMLRDLYEQLKVRVRN